MNDATVQPITPVSDDLRHHLVELSNQNLQHATLQDLQDLEHSAREAAKTLSATTARVNAELQRRFEGDLVSALQAKDEPYGVANLERDGFTIKGDQAKKVEWNQATLQQKFEELEARGMNAQDYIDLEYNMPEKRFTALPKEIQEYFADARTVTPGSLKITITNPNGK